jgi:hypothetical protein
MDGDGDVDALSAARGDFQLAWFENETIHRSAKFSEEAVVAAAFGGARSVLAGDLDRDGDLDVLATSVGGGTEIGWWKNTDGHGAFGTQQVVNTQTAGASGAFLADLDGDGDLDVGSRSLGDDTIAWYENSDGEGSFGSRQDVATLTSVTSVFAADIDRDGDLDLVSGAAVGPPRIGWYENMDGMGSFSTAQVISTTAALPGSISAADLDGDGDPDVVSAHSATDQIAWYENLDGAGTFGTERLISAETDQPLSAFAVDVDGDGDLDVVSASRSDDKIAWYENSDGLGNFGTQRVISTELYMPYFATSGDIDGDGDLDVVGISLDDRSVTWYENSDGQGNFGAQQIVYTFQINTNTQGLGRSVFTADIDRDGDLDVLATVRGGTVAWYENRGGQFSLATTDVAQGVVNSDDGIDLLKIDVTHQGRAGDSDVELSGLELRFTDGTGTALSDSETNALLFALFLVLDDGPTPGVYEGTDSIVTLTTDFSSIATNGDGVLTWTLPDDQSALQVAFGAPETYFLVASTTSNAESQTPGAFDVTHRTESSSKGEDANADIPLNLEYTANVGTAKIDTALSTASCQAPFDLQLSNRTIGGSLTCEAGTVLNALQDVTVTSAGSLTLRAGQSISFSFNIAFEAGSALTAEIDPLLEP